MSVSDEFGEVVRRIVGERSQRQVAVETQISQGTVCNMVRGIVPSRRLLLQFADALEVRGKVRRDLFRTAGYVERVQAAEVLA